MSIRRTADDRVAGGFVDREGMVVVCRRTGGRTRELLCRADPGEKNID